MWYDDSMNVIDKTLAKRDKIEIAELRKRLAELTRRTEEGESFFITRYGRTVASLGPPDERD